MIAKRFAASESKHISPPASFKTVGVVASAEATGRA
jgi:hypothetical protein